MQKIPSTRPISDNQTFKYNGLLRLFGTRDENDKEKSLSIPNARKISDQAVIKSRFPEADEQVLTAHELSRETLNYSGISKESKQRRLSAIPGKFFDTRSAEIPSRKTLSNMQQQSSFPFISEHESKNLKSCSADVLLESGKKSLSTVPEKGHALSHKRKFGLLPPTPSIISTSPKRPSSNRSKESVISQSSTMSKVFFTRFLLNFIIFITFTLFIIIGRDYFSSLEIILRSINWY